MLRVTEETCEGWSGTQVVQLSFAPHFPTPRTERVAPGHLVAAATAPTGAGVVVWRWFDAVVIGPDGPGRSRLWEPGHGEILAQQRDPALALVPGSRVYASSGLPGADWWVAGPVATDPGAAGVELAAVRALCTENGLWASVFSG